MKSSAGPGVPPEVTRVNACGARRSLASEKATRGIPRKFTLRLLTRISSPATSTIVPASSPKTPLTASCATSLEPAISTGVRALRKATLISRYSTATAAAPPSRMRGSARPASRVSSAILAASSQP